MRFHDVIHSIEQYRGLAGRRVWIGHGRAHVALRPLDRDEYEQVAPQIESMMSAVDGIAWARINPELGRLIIAFDPQRHGLESLVAHVGSIETQLNIASRDFERATRDEHPGDVEPIVRDVLELSADAAGFLAGTALWAMRMRPPAIDVDLAALLSALDSVPRWRDRIEQRLGVDNTELALGLLNAFNQAMLQSTVGPLGEMVRRTLRLRALVARRALWADVEPRLCREPALAHTHQNGVLKRPRKRPDGPIEVYSEKAMSASLGGFGLGLASTLSVERASAALFGAMPKPARWCREAFVSSFGRHLSRRGILVINSSVLRRLDCIDTIVVQGEILGQSHRMIGKVHAEPILGADTLAFVNAVHRTGLQLVVITHRAESIAWAKPNRIVSDKTSAHDVVRDLQQHGHGVCYIGFRTGAAMHLSDCGVGLCTPHHVPWGAHMLTWGGLADAIAVIHGIGQARHASKQGVQIAMVEAAASALVSLDGLRPQTTRRIMTVAGLASLASLGNGVRLARRAARQTEMGTQSWACDLTPWHALDVQTVLERTRSRPTGLLEHEAALRRTHLSMQPSAAAEFARLVLDEMSNPLAPVLGVGAALSALVGSVADAALIGTVAGINGLIGGSQRFRIERTLARMDRTERAPVRVRRGAGVNVDCEVRDLVVGDIVLLDAGCSVPADCRIISATALEVDESSLTGESLPVHKHAAPSYAALITERSSMLYEGTSIASGDAVAVVMAIGAQTETQRAALIGEELDQHTGVEARLNAITEMTIPMAAISGLTVMAAGLARKQHMPQVLGAAVSLAVAAVPEGLPILATMAQLAAAGRLSAHGALVRNPRAVEALGRVDVLCADKTGTLTEGRIRLAMLADGVNEWVVNGDLALSDTMKQVLRVGLRASPEFTADQARLPHATDQALVDGSQQWGVVVHADSSMWRRRDELPFEPARGLHAVLGSLDDAKWLCVKGAPEVIIGRCTRWYKSSAISSAAGKHAKDGREIILRAAQRRALMDEANRLACKGLRVLAVAQRQADDVTSIIDQDIQKLSFVGLIAFADPVRASAQQAVDNLRRAGVKIMMVTGDHPSTAESIAAELGFDQPGNVITGFQLDSMDDATLIQRLSDTSVFARVTPAQKVRVVRALEEAGHTVAMTGDGANDAPAMRRASVGIAVGESSTAAARHAADVVVVDGRIETIVQAILEGRSLWASVRDAVGVLVGGNIGEIAFTVMGSLLGRASPLNARQLLLVNLLTDTLPAMAIALRPPPHIDPEALLQEGPEKSLGASLRRDIIWRACVTAGAASGTWGVARWMGSPERSGTVALLALVGAQMGQTLVAAKPSKGVVVASVGSLAALTAIVQTPGVSHFFGCRPLGPVGLMQAATATVVATGVSKMAPPMVTRMTRLIGEERIQRAQKNVMAHPIVRFLRETAARSEPAASAVGVA